MESTRNTPKEFHLSFTPAELKALREAADALGYNMPGLTTAQDKLRAAAKEVKA